MNFQDTTKPVVPYVEPELTPALAQEIFAAEGTPIEIFNNPSYNYNWRHIKKVFQHGKKLRGYMRQAMRGNYVITPAVPAVLDEEGNVTTPAVPAVYFAPTTVTAFKAFMNALYIEKAAEFNELVLLDITAVGLQLMDGMTWAQWKASF